MKYSSIFIKFLLILFSVSFYHNLTSQVRTPAEIDYHITTKNKSKTAYYFDDFLVADLKFRNSKKNGTDQINLDVFAKQLDIKKDNKIYTLEKEDIQFAVIDEVDGLQNVVILFEENEFNIFYYRGPKYAVANIPSAKFYKKNYNAPGETNKTKLTVKDSYRIIEGMKTYEISMNNKGVIKALGAPAEKILKREKMKIRSVNDLVKLIIELEKV